MELLVLAVIYRAMVCAILVLIGAIFLVHL